VLEGLPVAGLLKSGQAKAEHARGRVVAAEAALHEGPLQPDLIGRRIPGAEKLLAFGVPPHFPGQRIPAQDAQAGAGPQERAKPFRGNGPEMPVGSPIEGQSLGETSPGAELVGSVE
jgi:hypothetical protein